MILIQFAVLAFAAVVAFQLLVATAAFWLTRGEAGGRERDDPAATCRYCGRDYSDRRDVACGSCRWRCP